MRVSYNPLWKILIDKKMKKTDLINYIGISPNTLSRLSKDEFVRLETVAKIALYLGVQLSDIAIINNDN